MACRVPGRVKQTGSSPSHGAALRSGPCHCCPGACKALLSLLVPPKVGVESLVTGVQVASAPPEGSPVTWLPNKMAWERGVGWAK